MLKKLTLFCLLALNGICGVYQTPTATSYVSATGGVVTNYSQNGVLYRAHIFTNSGTFTVTQGGQVDALVVAGGGGGGSRYGGGGAAGQVIVTNLLVAHASTAITIGGGGLGNLDAGSGGTGENGNTSSFGSIVASGGGGSSFGAFPPISTSGNGFTTGDGRTGTPSFTGGGGAGATQDGFDSPEHIGGAGGAGVSNSFSGIALGYGGGGGGGAYNGFGAISAGLGTYRGGNGGFGGAGGNAVANSGSGGGGGGGAAGVGNGGNGGSGIVIVRYQTQFSPASDFTYTTNNNEITITGYIGAGGQVNIPETIDGFPVTKTGLSSFFYKTSITGCLLPKTLKNLGESTFEGCSNITSIRVPVSVTNLDNYVFYTCTKLASVYFDGSSAPTIGSYVFYLVPATIYHAREATGFGKPPDLFAGRPTAYWNPNEKQDTVITKALSKPLLNDPSLTNGLVLHYKMDEAKWSGTAGEVIDSSVAGNHGTSYGGVQTNPGKLNRAGQFDGVGGYVGTPLLSTGISFSYSVWFYAKSIPSGSSDAYFVAQGSKDRNIGIRFGKLYNWTTLNTGTTILETGKWYYAVLSCSNSVLTMYLNGLVESGPTLATGGNLGADGRVIIGMFDYYNSGAFDGFLDDVRIYNRALSSNEVARLYQATLPEKKPMAVYQGTKLVSNPRGVGYQKNNPVYYTPISDLTFTTNEVGIVITGYTGNNPVLRIPNKINGYPVATIDYRAFWVNDYIKSCTLPDSVVSLGNGETWRYTAITNIVLSSNLTTLPTLIFQYSSIPSIVIPAKVTSFTGLTFLQVPSLTKIYFLGNCPSSFSYKSTDLTGDSSTPSSNGAKAYYRAGATGFNPLIGDGGNGANIPTEIWTSYPNPMP